jgi:hypothetical protein
MERVKRLFSKRYLANLSVQAVSWVRRCLSLHRILFVVGLLIFIVGCYWLNRVRVVLGSSDRASLETLATAAAALVAVAALFFTLAQQAADRADEQSRFYLEEYRKGYDVAYVVLRSADAADPRIRLKWIAAARILESARRLIPRVTVKEHRDVLNMDIPRQSERFQPFFEHIAQYYYGVIPPNYSTGAKKEWLHEAARRSTNPKDGVLNFHREIPERVLRTVWLAVQYPKEYCDVLGDQFDDGEALFLPPGMRDYVQHSRTYNSAMGKLYDLQGNEVPPTAHNDLVSPARTTPSDS